VFADLFPRGGSAPATPLQPVVVPRRMSEAVGTTPLLHAQC
jgi:hypothetical protein